MFFYTFVPDIKMNKNMNNRHFFLFALICLGGSACSPRINTRITKNYPPQAPDAPVAVYTKAPDVPPQSEPIGTVDIGDTGFTTNCDSATVFSLAKTETRKAGGNGLLVTRYLRPSFFGSSCHQISGTMLLVSDFSRTENDSPETITFVQAQPAEVSYQQPSNQFPRMSFMLDAGYNWRTAKISDDLDDFGKHLVKQIKSGFLWNGSLAYFFKNYYGIGFSFQQFRASHETFGEDLNTGQTGVLKISDRISYIGPAFMMQTPLGKSDWLFDLCFSIGYIGYVSNLNFVNLKRSVSGASVGFQSEVGLSYKITPEWAIGFKLLSTDGTLFQYTLDENGHKTTVKMDAKNCESLSQFGLSLGIRYYINSK